MFQQLLDNGTEQNGMSRRRMLQTTAAASGAAVIGGLAGCSSNNNESPATTTTPTQPPLPDYAQWIGAKDIPEEGEESIGFIRADFQALNDLTKQSDSTDSEIAPELSEKETQFITLPVYGSAMLLLVMGFGLMPYGDIAQRAYTDSFPSSGSEETTTTTAPSQQTTSGILVGNTVILQGTYDEEALLDEVTTFEKKTERDGFSIYTGKSTENSFIDPTGYAFAVSENAIVFAMEDSDSSETTTTEQTTTVSDSVKLENTLERLNERLDIKVGEANRAADVSDALDHGMRTVGDKMFIFGGSRATNLTEATEDEEAPATTTTSEFNEINTIVDNADVMVMGTSIVTQDKAKTAMSVRYSSAEDVPSEDTFEEFVASAKTRDITIDGQTADITGAWTGIRATTAPTTTESS